MGNSRKSKFPNFVCQRKFSKKREREKTTSGKDYTRAKHFNTFCELEWPLRAVFLLHHSFYFSNFFYDHWELQQQSSAKPPEDKVGVTRIRPLAIIV